MAKPFINVKRKPKDGSMLSEVWNDGSEHEVKQAAFISLFLGSDGRPYAVLSNEVKTALRKGGMNPDDFYLNVYTEDGGTIAASQRKPGASAPRKPPSSTSRVVTSKTDVDNLFDE